MQESDPTTPGQKGGYRRALADSPNVVLACLNLIGNLVVIIPLLAMPIFVLYQLKAGAWVPGLARRSERDGHLIGSVLNARFTRGRRRVRSLQLSVHCGQSGSPSSWWPTSAAPPSSPPSSWR